MKKWILTEIAWEVCQQLGGIYTVLKSKASEMVDKWGDDYFLIGPYNAHSASIEFEPAADERIDEILALLPFPVYHGRWLVSGRPHVLLIDLTRQQGSLAENKYLLWKDHSIETPGSDNELDQTILFGYAVATLLAALNQKYEVLAHFHEWMAGVAIPVMNHQKVPIKKVFTTHATLLGRYVASDRPDFYEMLPFMNPVAQAAHYNIAARSAIERAAAHGAEVFSTVSEVTAKEAEVILGRKPDTLLPNGLNIQKFAALHEFQNLHRQYKEKIHEFIMGHFFPSYSFDLENTLYFFTSGRYEYKNKGMDLFIEALLRLNERLKMTENPVNVVAFIVTRAEVASINVNVLKNKSMLDDLKSLCENLQEKIGQRLFRSAAEGMPVDSTSLLDANELTLIKRHSHAFAAQRDPSVVTHDLLNPYHDPILRHLQHKGLLNRKEDPVKMIFHPEFVTLTSPLLKMDYDQFVRGCHLGVFPSYYEPWGYTPMECIASGLPAVTSDLSGFGAYVQSTVTEATENGIFVLNRSSKHFDSQADDLADYFEHFCSMNRRQRIELRNRSERMSDQFGWDNLASHYHDLHQSLMAKK